MDESQALQAAISKAKAQSNGQNLVLGHHYQREEIIQVCDFIGDSFGLSRQASNHAAAKIYFCGVRFMAESAAILCPEKEVYLPDPLASCPLADMASLSQVQFAYKSLEARFRGKRLCPLVYINSSAELKAFCGEKGGLICTSSSAEAALRWALAQADLVFFLPDRNLGYNTARRLDLADSEIATWDPEKENGGLGKTNTKIRLLLWNGHCHVHTWFNLGQIQQARRKHTDCAIIVHPECNPDVVDAADEDGSTEQLVRFVEQAEPGSKIGVATEINLVARLARRFPDREVFPLSRSLCPNMFRTSLEKLHQVMTAPQPEQRIAIPPRLAANARLALQRMLALN